MITLEEARNNIGRNVIYSPYYGCHKDDEEVGIIRSVSNLYVFVQFGQRTPGRGEACRPDDLRFEVDG